MWASLMYITHSVLDWVPFNIPLCSLTHSLNRSPARSLRCALANLSGHSSPFGLSVSSACWGNEWFLFNGFYCWVAAISFIYLFSLFYKHAFFNKNKKISVEWSSGSGRFFSLSWRSMCSHLKSDNVQHRLFAVGLAIALLKNKKVSLIE